MNGFNKGLKGAMERQSRFWIRLDRDQKRTEMGSIREKE